MLWMVETPAEGAAERLRSAPPGWELSRLDGVTWTYARGEDRVTIVLGRQVAVEEGLEVLVVGTDGAESGLGLNDVIERWIDEDVLVMLPWGFGKWMGRRARLVAGALADYGGRGLRLADTGLRTAWMPVPPLLERARASGYPVFVGSDPFPFPDRVHSIGSHGFRLDVVEGELAWPQLLALLRAAGPEDLQRFGTYLGTGAFLALQGRIQLRKRLGGAT